MSKKHKTVNSKSISPSEDENHDNVNQTGSNIESTHDKTFVEWNTNPTEKKTQNPQQTQDSSFSDKFTERMENHPQ